MLSVTLIILILTAIISFTAFSNRKVIDDLIFYPPAITRRNQWYRFLSCALIHADPMHLIFNMWAFYMFGSMLENNFNYIFEEKGPILYVALYLISQIICLIPSYVQNKDNYYYKSLGASGAVSAVVFATIFLFPLTGVGIILIPIRIPGFIFGFIYLGITMYMARRGGDNINHSAHFFGAASGIVLLLIFCYAFSSFDPVQNFISQIRMYTGL
ncbi:rhomboid family intramembrane serine protease [Aridibaculum aurantiacum]|uniref:rhomboid family intramembrane serine protease n=1 Tax=Aridibaculum aurantiacum TaxID=2810307 RepID=UPI001A97BA22|nr:rhomboid family intramembrane serine protease [Aridibaculum aurantiacum]